MNGLRRRARQVAAGRAPALIDWPPLASNEGANVIGKSVVLDAAKMYFTPQGGGDGG